MITEEPGISKLIHRAITEAVELAIQEEIKSVGKRVEDKVRGQVGTISARVLQKFSFERIGDTLRIEVNFSKEPQ